MDERGAREGDQAMTRRTALSGMTALFLSGCFGEFAATRALYDWNTDVSDNKWLRWLVFLALAILPVYWLFIVADALVLNTIEFFTGNNPVGGSELSLADGSTLESSRTKDPNLIRHEHRKDGELVRVVYVRRVSDQELLVLDEHQRLVSRLRVNEDGSARVFDAAGRELSFMTRQACDRVALAIEAGASITQAVHGELERNGSALAIR